MFQKRSGQADRTGACDRRREKSGSGYEGDAGTGSDNLDIPIKIGGPSSGLYARLIAQGSGKWADGYTYDGFIVYKVYGS